MNELDIINEHSQLKAEIKTREERLKELESMLFELHPELKSQAATKVEYPLFVAKSREMVVLDQVQCKELLRTRPEMLDIFNLSANKEDILKYKEILEGRFSTKWTKPSIAQR